MSKNIIYFLRHGEVENPKRILYGRLPGFGLSINGVRRINEVAQDFKNKNIDLIFTSPMKRTRETARIISEVILKKTLVSRYLIEAKLIHDGMPLDIFKRDFQADLYNEKFVDMGQESFQAQSVRMMKFVKMVTERYKGKTLLAVSHGDPIMILRAKIQHISFTWEFKRDNYLQPGHYLKLSAVGNNYNWV